MQVKPLASLAIALLVAASIVGVGCSDQDNDGDTEGTPAPAEVQLTQDDDGATVTLAANGTLIVALPANRSTGFSWAIVSPEPEHLELDGAPAYVPPGSTSPVPGAAGTEVFTLKATGAGVSELAMEYRRMDGPPGDEPEDQFTVTVETR